VAHISFDMTVPRAINASTERGAEPIARQHASIGIQSKREFLWLVQRFIRAREFGRATLAIIFYTALVEVPP
jgi:hypothetical protein